MTCGKICKRNRALRERTFKYLDTIKVGTRIKSSVVAEKMTNKRIAVMPGTIGSFLREREDYKRKGDGVWERVSDKVTMDAVK